MPHREYVVSSGNVFADLGLPNADGLLVKAELTVKILQEIRRRRLTQVQAASVLGIDQLKVSALKQGKLTSFSIERLMRFLLLLGRDVEIAVKDRPKSRSAARLLEPLLDQFGSEVYDHWVSTDRHKITQFSVS